MLSRIVVGLLFLTTASWGHNASVLTAPIADDIVVDGDLSDWPEAAVAAQLGGQVAMSEPTDRADLDATVRAAWDPAAMHLFVALEVVDQSQVVIDTATAWNASDGSEVFLDLRHREIDSPTLQHVLYGVDHQVYATGGDSADHGPADYGVSRSDGAHRYEWRFDLARIPGGDALTAGDVIGFDVAVADRDEDGSFSWVAWGPGTGKSGNSHRLGDLLLLSADTPARIEGAVRWKRDNGPPPRRVRIHKDKSDDYGLVVAADREGVYQADLAPGTYRVRPMDLRIRKDRDVERKVKAKAGKVATVKRMTVPVESKTHLLVDQLFDGLDADAPGAAVLVASGDKVLHHGTYGLAQVELGVPVTTQTKFCIASVSKQFTSAAVMMLVEEGLVDLDVPLSTYLPDYPHADSLTTRQLMAHVSGIPNYLSMSEFWEVASLGRDMASLLDVFQHQELAFEPGTRYSYSNSGYVVLAHLLEQVSGKTYGQFLQERVFDPLGMTDSGVDHYRPILTHRAAGYALSNGALVNSSWLDMYLLTGAGNIYSTAGDLHKWAQSLNDATLLSRRSIDEMSRGYVLKDGNEISYGLGFRLAEFNGLQEVGHSGSINGFTSHFNRYPEQAFTVVVLDNSPWIAPGEIARQVAEIYLADQMVWDVASAEAD